MPDLKSMSDEELEAIAKGQKLQHLSDGELEKIAGKKEFPQAQEPQNLEENPSNFIEQQHPAVSTALRAAIQFGGGDRAAALQKQLGPDYKVTTQKGRIYVRGKGEKDNLAFDPDMSLMEMIKDYHPGHVPEVQKDLIYDNLDMGLQALLGGTAILPGLLGGGAINLAQQGIGNLTGGRRGLDVGEAAVNAGLGATTNAIPMATKAIATRTLPAAGEFLTGMPAQATKTYLEQGSKQVMGGTAREQMTALQSQAQEALTTARRAALSEVRAAPDAAAASAAKEKVGEIIDAERALQSFLKHPNPQLGSVGNAQRTANEAKLDLFKAIDEMAPGAGLQEGSERAFSRQEFTKPGLFPKGSPAKATMRAALGVGGTGLIGGALGLDPVSSAMLGLLGAPAVGPAALKAYIDVAQKAAPAVRSAWAPLGSELYEKVKDDGRQ